MSRSLMLVVQALLLSGCYNYRSMTIESQKDDGPPFEDPIRVMLKDGSVIESPAFMHIVTREPSDLVFGIGQDRYTLKTFKGVIRWSEIDSTRTISIGEQEVLVCWLKNKSSIAFKSREYLKLTTQDTLGLWCIGEKRTPGVSKDFRGLVPWDQIRESEVAELDSGNTLKLAAGIALLPVAVIVVAGVGAIVAWFARGL